jgi:hypothetical protein
LDRRLSGPRAGLDAVVRRTIFSLPGIEPRPSSPSVKERKEIYQILIIII